MIEHGPTPPHIDPYEGPHAHVACPACGRHRLDAGTATGTVTWVETSRGRNEWYRCGHCGAYHLHDTYDLDAEVAHTEARPWGQTKAGTELNDFKRRMFLAVLRLLEQYQPPPARLLDVGCSFGGFGIEANRAGYDVHGMDITPAAVEYVRSLGLDAQCASTPADLIGVPDGSIDVVTCLDCNTVWPDQPAQLVAIHAKLRPGGHLVMRVVDKSWMFTIGRRLRPISPRLAQRVMREAVNDGRFTMPVHTLRRLLDEQGFNVVAISIRAAVHSDQTRWPARAGFAVGAVLWPLFHRNYGPGAVLIATRRA